MLVAAEDDGARLNDEQLRDEVMTLVLAGHETTAMALVGVAAARRKSGRACLVAGGNRRCPRRPSPRGLRSAGAAPDARRGGRVHAAVPAGVDSRAPSAQRPRRGRLHAACRRACPCKSIRDAAQRAVVARSLGFRAVAVARRLGALRRAGARGHREERGSCSGSGIDGASGSSSPGPRRRWCWRPSGGAGYSTGRGPRRRGDCARGDAAPFGRHWDGGPSPLTARLGAWVRIGSGGSWPGRAW